MSFFDALFGRTRLKKPQFDPFFRLSASLPDLEAKGLAFAGEAGVCCRPGEEQAFEDAFAQAVAVTRLYAQEHALTLETPTDRENFRWVVLRQGSCDDIVTGLHAASDTLEGQGYGGTLLAAILPFSDHGGRTYLIYNYKRGMFYPFRPRGNQDRDEAHELQLQAILGAFLPIDPHLERWYPLWDTPL